MLLRAEKAESASVETPAEKATRSVRLRYALYAGIVVAAAVFLPMVAGRLAEETGLGESFVGSLFVAATTSLPEVVVTIVAVRMGAPDLALGNILGSNLFNVVILGLDEFWYTPGLILEDASPHKVFSVLGVLLMYGAIALWTTPLRGLITRRIAGLSLGAWLLVAIYASTQVTLFLLT